MRYTLFILFFITTLLNAQNKSMLKFSNGKYYYPIVNSKQNLYGIKAGFEKVYEDTIPDTPTDTSLFSVILKYDFEEAVIEKFTDGTSAYQKDDVFKTSVVDYIEYGGDHGGYQGTEYPILGTSGIEYHGDGVNNTKVFVGEVKAGSSARYGYDYTIHFKNNYQTLWVSYNFKNDDNFLYIDGGKYIGIGSYPLCPFPQGPDYPENRDCLPTDGSDWVTTWTNKGGMYAFLKDNYMPDGSYSYAQPLPYAFIKPGKWYNLTIRVECSTAPGNNDAFAEYFLNGRFIYRTTQPVVSHNTAGKGINALDLMYFYGGAEEAHKAIKDTKRWADDIYVYTFKPESGIFQNRELSQPGSTVPLPQPVIHWDQEPLDMTEPDRCVNEAFTATSGRVTDNDEDEYFNYWNDCDKQISVAGASKIRLNFEQLSLDPYGDVKLRVYSGTNKSNLIATYTKYYNPNAVELIVNSANVLIEFDMKNFNPTYPLDGANSGEGFIINYQALDSSNNPL